MFSIADLKRDLPAWPDDVIDQWLLYFANEPDCGWPPPELSDYHRWNGMLGGRPLSWWKEVTWKKETVDCGLQNLSDKSKAIVTELGAAFADKTADPVTARRIKHAYIYVMDHTALPKPVIMMKVSSGLNVLDGSHRMAAFHALQKTPDDAFKKQKKQKASPIQEAWIGTHSAGEVTLT
jgi:hypothetical protein